MLRENYKVLAARVIVEFLGKFKFLDSVIPIHIPHPYQGQMAEKSVLSYSDANVTERREKLQRYGRHT